MGNDELWPYLVALPGLLSVYYLLNVCVVPNTPAHYLRCGKGNDALRQLRRLRKRNQVPDEEDVLFLLHERWFVDDRLMCNAGFVLCYVCLCFFFS